MDKDTRNDIERATQRARKLLEEDFAQQLEGTFDVHRSGMVGPRAGTHLLPHQVVQRERVVAAIEHKRVVGMSAPQAVADYVRDAAFTNLNRFAALKMIEARHLFVEHEYITRGEQSAGYRAFCGMAPGLALLPEAAGYRLYIESLFDELSTEVKVLFDRRDPASVLWPRRATFEALLEVLNTIELAGVWDEDETIGWVYQFFNSGEERKRMRDESQAPRNSRELAVRNQFFTPRYVVQFLTDNTLGRTWWQMRGGETALVDRCEYLVRDGELGAPRAKKDPRDLKVLDPACGSGHFLLYAFNLFVVIYEEAWQDQTSGVTSVATGRSLRQDYPDLADLRSAMPALILQHNLHGVDIDPRCAQIAALALWLRAQRAFRDFGLPPSERAPITRTHIVVAEPMPGDQEMVETFAASLDPPLLGDLFRTMVSEMRLAGELGTLLRVEDGIAAQLTRAREQFVSQRERPTFLPDMQPVRRQGELDLSGIDDAQFFHEAEERLLSALRHFAELASGRASIRRRLFAGDAVQGIALIDVLRTRFDVVLMNPPFGESTAEAQQYTAENFPEGVNDIYAAFVIRFSQVLTEQGTLGAITSRSFFVGRDLRAFRKRLLDAPRSRLQLVLDLGLGVLDAMVETAAYVIGDGPGKTIRFLDARDATKNAASIDVALSHGAWQELDIDHLRSLPGSQLLYDISEEDAGSLTSGKRIEPTIGRVTKGLSTGDDERFVRLRWEVGVAACPGTGWELFSKGGEYGWFGSDVHLLVRRHSDGAELAAHAERTHGNVALSRQSSTYYHRVAVTWSRRSQKGFSARRLRPGVCFSDKSPVVVPSDEPQRWIPALLAVLSTEKYLNLIYAQSKFGSYETGSIKTLPVPAESLSLGAVDVMNRLFRAIDEIDARDETCQLFVSPPPPDWDPISRVRAELDDLGSFLRECGETLSQEVVDHTLDTASSRVEQLLSPLAWISFAVGVALGRWDGAAQPLVSLPGPLDLLSAHTSAGALPVEGGANQSRAEWLSDDEGTTTDVVAAVGLVLSRHGQHRSVGSELRETIAKSLFAWHLAKYSKSARRAPILWQLGCSSARYSVWVYYHRINRDSLFRLQSDYASPKLLHEETKLERLRQECGSSPTSAQRQELSAQAAFVDELRTFLDEVRRVAPLWNPNSDDGVAINFAPLWRLVPHQKPWQKDVKATWDALCAGELDWAHIAMHLWPERVVPKCATDRSLAIAHDLDGVFWVEGADGKWLPRSTPTRSVVDLVRERTSSAVKAALKSLLEAPVATGTGGRKRRNAVAVGEGAH